MKGCVVGKQNTRASSLSFNFGDATPWAIKVPDRVVVVAYGGGVNTIALLVLLKRLAVVPRAIVMSDPGSEWPETHAYREQIANPWLDSIGFPRVTMVSRKNEVEPRAGSAATSADGLAETLAEECYRTKTLPSAAYGWKRCSQKYKAEPQQRWIGRQDWARAEWEAGRKLVKAIGYDADEPGRIRLAFGVPWEAARMDPWYPVHEAGLGRSECVEIIREEGLDVPPSSSCTFCPNAQPEDWIRLREEHPDLFAEALAMEERASETIDTPDVVGLLRNAPHGKRQLRMWASGNAPCPAGPVDMPCECAL